MATSFCRPTPSVTLQALFSCSRCPQSAPFQLQRLQQRSISAFRFRRQKRWSKSSKRVDPISLYAIDQPIKPLQQDPSAEFPTIHFWEQDDAGERQHVTTIRSESELHDLRRKEMDQDDLLEEMEMEYEGPSSNFPPDAYVRLMSRVREVEDDAEHQTAMRKLMVMKPEDRSTLEKLRPDEVRYEVPDEDMRDAGYTISDVREQVENDPSTAAMHNLSSSLAASLSNDSKPISPYIKSLNSALCMAYVGANEEIRSELWQCYSRAKIHLREEGVLEWIPDDAWDMIYWSQAANWGPNTNREQHLKILEEDLRSVGRDGPPTKEL